MAVASLHLLSMLRATIHFDLECDSALSDATKQCSHPLEVSHEELHDDGMITVVIDAGGERAAIQKRLEAAPEVEHVEAIDDNRILLTKPASGALPVIRENHGMLQGLDKVKGSHRVFDVVVFRRSDLKAITSGLSEFGTVRLGMLTRYGDRTASLSPRQTEVIQAALEAGYFDWPRQTDAESLANSLDISHPTLLEHLRKAEKKLIEEALERS